MGQGSWSSFGVGVEVKFQDRSQGSGIGSQDRGSGVRLYDQVLGSSFEEGVKVGLRDGGPGPVSGQGSF